MLRGKTKIKQSKYKFYSIRSSTFRLANDESQTKQSNKYRNTLEKKETERKRGHRLTHTHTHTHPCVLYSSYIHILWKNSQSIQVATATYVSRFSMATASSASFSLGPGQKKKCLAEHLFLIDISSTIL